MSSFSGRNITIIGAGKIAYSLSHALIKSGFKISSVVSRSSLSAGQLAKKFSIRNYSNELREMPADGIFFLCVPDDQIKPLVKKISLLKINFHGSLFVHMSGSLDTSYLDSLKKKEGFTGSLHIMQTFPSKKIQKIRNCYAAVEAKDTKVKDFLTKLCARLGLKAFLLEGDKKVYYHIAGVFASNFLAGNIFNSGRILEKTRVKNDSAELFRAILESTLRNINKLGAAGALSGPVERGDCKTVRNHIAALKKYSGKNKINDLLISYISQSLSLLKLVKKKSGKLNEAHRKTMGTLLRELKYIPKG